jgi:hypothetical protein
MEREILFHNFKYMARKTYAPSQVRPLVVMMFKQNIKHI